MIISYKINLMIMIKLKLKQKVNFFNQIKKIKIQIKKI